MSSQETPRASSSRGTTIPLEATTGIGNLDNRIEDVDIALGQPTGGSFKLEFFREIEDPEGVLKVQVSDFAAPHHDLPSPPVPDLASDLCKEIIDQFYEARFEQLEIVKADACEDYYTTDDDDSSYVL